MFSCVADFHSLNFSTCSVLLGCLCLPSDLCFSIFFCFFFSFLVFFSSSSVDLPFCFLCQFLLFPFFQCHLCEDWILLHFEGSVMKCFEWSVLRGVPSPLILCPLALVRTSGRAAAPGLTPLRLPRAPRITKTTSIIFSPCHQRVHWPTTGFCVCIGTSTPLRPDIWAVNKCAHTRVFMLACSFLCFLYDIGSK